MGASVIDAILRGQPGAWIGLFVVVLVAALVALLQRPGTTSVGRVLLMAAITSVLSAGGILVAMALSVPRIVWREAPLPPFAVASGAMWRSLRAPAATVLDKGRPEIAIPGLDAAGKVRLYGLFSGAALDGYAEAPEGPPVSGSPRICRVDREECRPWPKAWPEPVAAPPISDFIWARELFSGAMAFDVESGRFLHHVDGLRMAGEPMKSTAAPAPVGARSVAGTWGLEQVGKFTNEPARDGETALFVVRRIAGGRLDAVRLVAGPSGESFAYGLERATVSLEAGPAVLTWFARPLLLVLVLWFPVVTIAFQAAPAWWASRRRKLMAEGKELPPMPSDPGAFSRAARQAMAGRLHGLALLCVGLAVAAPAIVAVVGMVTSR
jgi:hypothetical protein